MIYDRNVILAIKAAGSAAFARTKASLGTGSSFYHRGTATYGSFVAEAEALARVRGVSPDQVEVGLFLSRVDPRSGWGR